ncbi:hypothetical protein FH972_019547 [Carpinus fangiana]|uniref:Uncharacterized protein n=1 Tax=Carpinus fangiana TaxID=176857 RepID=A0A5N6RQZ3_9ROSI|nr:hypothetical protein FH972_019547 [Carpinus fangiana]
MPAPPNPDTFISHVSNADSLECRGQCDAYALLHMSKPNPETLALLLSSFRSACSRANSRGD